MRTHEEIIKTYTELSNSIRIYRSATEHRTKRILLYFYLCIWLPAMYYLHAANFFSQIVPKNGFILIAIMLLYTGLWFEAIIRRSCIYVTLRPIQQICNAMATFHAIQNNQEWQYKNNSVIMEITNKIYLVYQLHETLYQQSQSRLLQSVSGRLRTLLGESSLYMIQEISRLRSELHSQLTIQIDDLESAREQVNWLQRPSLTADIQARLDRQIEQFWLLQKKLQNNTPTK